MSDGRRERSPLLPQSELGSRHSAEDDDAKLPQPDDEEVHREQVVKEFSLDTELRRQVIRITPALGLGLVLSALDQSLLAAANGAIGSDLNALDKISWLATAYFLTYTSVQPLYGRLSDIFGRKAMLLWTYSVYGLGCLLCGLARNMTELVLARAFAGIGGGGLTTVTAIVICDVTSTRERGNWQGYVNTVFYSASALGYCLGGLLVDSVGWRWIFLLRAPLALVAVVIVSSILVRPPQATHWLAQLKRIDVYGTLTLTTAILTLLIGLSWGSIHSWRSATSTGCLSASLALFAAFPFVEAKVAAEPIVPMRIIRKRTLFACYVSHFFSHAAFMTTNYYMPLYFQAAKGLSATQAGLRTMPLVLASMVGSVVAGRVMEKTSKFFILNVCGYLLMVLGLLLVLVSTSLDVSFTWLILIAFAVTGYSQGTSSTSTFIAIVSQVPAEDQAIATACSYLSRSLGSTIGVSASSSLMQQVLRTGLRASLGDSKDVERITEQVRHSLEYLRTLSPEITRVVRKCYGHAIGGTFLVNVCLAATAVGASLFVKDKSLG